VDAPALAQRRRRRRLDAGGPRSGNYTGDCDLSTWLGHSLQLKFVVVTDDNNDGGTGLGVWLDDINLSYAPPSRSRFPSPQAIPRLRAARMVGADLLESLDCMGRRRMRAGRWRGRTCRVGRAAKYRPIDLNPYEGCLLTRVRFFPMESNCDYSIRIRSGENRSSSASKAFRHRILPSGTK
jgi:hypothetical protein